MSEDTKKITPERAEMHRIDNERNTGIQLARRDSELYFALGIFIVALGLPVVFGTYYAYEWGSIKPAVVNLISGLVMVAIGAASIFYGWLIRRRIKGEQ
ncbi:MAG: hypothetical protein N3G21_08575 [Candidatus Hydrogenedentes bacterium]|nr:hypothetical protein [Candidatus Hydrogenedentota bacterium]